MKLYRLTLFIFLLLCTQCATLQSGNASRVSYRAGQQVQRLDYALKTNDTALLRAEAGRAKSLIAELSSIQAQAQDRHVACKEKLAGCTKYKWGFIGLAAFLGLLAVWKIRRVFV